MKTNINTERKTKRDKYNGWKTNAYICIHIYKDIYTLQSSGVEEEGKGGSPLAVT